MNVPKPYLIFLQRWLPLLYVGFFASCFFNLRAVASIAEALLLAAGIVFGLADRGDQRFRAKNYFIIGLIAFYLLQLVSLFYTSDMSTGMHQLQVKLSFLIIPPALYLAKYLNEDFRNKIMPYYVMLLAAATLWCLAIAGFSFANHHDSSVFFYHSLVKPFDQHAVHYSIFVFIGLIYLLDSATEGAFVLNRPFHFFLIGYFLLFIVLLSSKLVIVFSFAGILLYIAVAITRSGRWKTKLLMSAVLIGALGVLLFSTRNPVSERFDDIFNGNINKIEQSRFTPNDYFNGVQFRLLQWKIVGETLSERHAWLLGVSPGDAQQVLNAKYVSLDMYMGGANGRSSGFLNYNTHNEFLEATLQNGIVGLLFFAAICAAFIQMMLKAQDTKLWLVGTLLLVYSMVESILQTQYGIILFTFFPLFFYYTSRRITIADSSQSNS